MSVCLVQDAAVEEGKAENITLRMSHEFYQLGHMHADEQKASISSRFVIVHVSHPHQGGAWGESIQCSVFDALNA